MSHLSFNEIILRLLDFWRQQGCLVWQPYNVQVGAGTMNPATYLRVLGPEPWNVVYVEPSIRPDDGRFGNNPNRMQQHHQLQVILKPDPGNPQELYLQSLAAIGINSRKHDIRFVEDNWESPALGAWGLGWEVWLDGQEITQFTYFQQAGGQNLDPVSIEITYGLDRICLALQGKKSVWEMDYGNNINYGQVLLQSEIEQCHYYFEVADVDALKAVYDTYEKEAERCLEANLIAPAHDYNLKCSHLFNVLDTRGAIGVTERANYFRRMRRLSRSVAEQYVAQRARLEHPLLPEEEIVPPQPAPRPPIQLAQLESPKTFLLEIGSEELPPADAEAAQQYFLNAIPDFLHDLRLDFERVELYGTPRRTAVIVHQLRGRQTDLEELVKGPPAERAYAPDGSPTKAAQGFARGKGISVDQLQTIEENGKKYVAALIKEVGRPSAQILAEHLPKLIDGLKFGKNMRWNKTNQLYSRPIRWLVALFGPDLVPFAYAGVKVGRYSRGLRPYNSPEIEIQDASHYLEEMAENNIIVDASAREKQILQGARTLAHARGGMIREDQALLSEICYLVESPTPFLGKFNEKYLKIPAEVLVAVMKKHQRYFAVYNDAQQLLPYFIAVRNGDEEHLDIVTDGNEQVLRARFADAEFFYEKDRKQTLSDFLLQLDTLTFQAELGSMLDKTNRLEKLVPLLAPHLGLSIHETEAATRAAFLAKADLATNMVVEMTSLQGIMGGHYARIQNEPKSVALAIAEQYNAVSQTAPGLALAVADRLDSLVGLFAAGLAPKGSNDPFALRRSAIQLIENLLGNSISFSLNEGIELASSLMPIDVSAETKTAVHQFITNRLDVVLREQIGYPTSLVKAILEEAADNPYLARHYTAELYEAVQRDDWSTLLDAFARCVRITRSQTEEFTVYPEKYELEAERDLWRSYQAVAESQDGQLTTFMTGIEQLTPAINQFFDSVLVMDENLDLRHNRLGLLQKIASLSKGLVDLSFVDGF